MSIYISKITKLLKKLKFYGGNAIILFLPDIIYRKYADCILSPSKLSNNADCVYIEERVNYYNKCNTSFNVSSTDDSYAKVGSFNKTSSWTYYYDLKKHIRCFSPDYCFNYINGDVVHIPNVPSFIKSRPISDDNQNSVVMKLEAMRHYIFLNDTIPFEQKKDIVIWRGSRNQHRRAIIEKYITNPLCDFGETNKDGEAPFKKDFITIADHLKYKFVLSIEGNDVATNLKWIMSSGSAVVMTKPKYETWFMEGRLMPDIHYISVDSDYSNLIEKLEYYINNPDKTMQIIANANTWVDQFKDKGRERLISLMVADKYFRLSGQRN